MNTLFIYSVDEINSFSSPLLGLGWLQFGISYISSFLKKHKHDTRLVILSRLLGKKNFGIIDGYLEQFYPKLICFTAVSSEFNFIERIAKYIRNRNPDIYLLIGGPHASLNPREALSGAFDAVCIGEGESAVLELVLQLEKGIPPSAIPNLWIKNGPAIEKNMPRPFLQDLDSLPFPDRKMWQEWLPPGTVVTQPV